MIQYQYFHTGRGYVPRFSVSQGTEQYYVVEDLFETVRKNTAGHTFTYAPAGDSYLYLQCSNHKNGDYAKGLLCDTISDIPAKYIDKFETEVSRDDVNSEQLPEGELPVLGRLVEDFSLAMNLHHIFPKLIDALLYGDPSKKIVIIAEDRESAINYIKVLSMLLPLSYVKTIGFCIGSGSVPDGNMTFTNESGATDDVSVRIWLPDIADFDFATYASFYYVFDTKASKDNYSRPLSAVAKVLEELNLCNQDQAGDFANCIASAFTKDGRVEFERIDRIATIYLFGLKKDVATAKTVIHMGSGDNFLQENAVIEAIGFLLEPINSDQVDAADRKRIIQEYHSNESVAQSTEETLYRYLMSVYDVLDQEDKDELIRMIADDEQGERLQDMVYSAMRGDYQALLSSFSLGLDVLKVRIEDNGPRVFNNQEIVRILIESFDFARIRQIVPANQLTGGEELFDLVWRQNDAELVRVAAAILMSSAYSSDVIAECCTVRIRGFRRMMENSGLSPFEQLKFITDVRNIVLEIGNEIPELDIANTQFDFLFNVEYGKQWVNGLVLSLSMEATIKAEDFVRNQSDSMGFYESLSLAINDKLLDEEYIKNNVKSDSPFLPKYLEYYNRLSPDLRCASAEIQAYLNELNRESGINDALIQYRCNFAFDCYRTLSLENRQKVMPNTGGIASFSQLNQTDRKKAVEDTIKVFDGGAKTKKRNRTTRKSFVLWALGLSVLSSVLLVCPAIIQAMALGSLDITLAIEYILNYFKPGYILIPLYVFLLNVISYFVFRKGNRILRANIITLLCGILPVCMFALGYLIVYFMLSLPLLQNLFV